MSAQLQGRACGTRSLSPMTIERLDAVMPIEREAYAVPWTRGNFIDSLANGYQAMCLTDGCGVMLGYFVAMQGAGEMHLLNLTVAPPEQGRGHARHLLDALVLAGLQASVSALWLEVRESNERARRIYRRYGFVEAGVRKGYYPTSLTQTSARREDAVVMSLLLSEAR
jgi:ribosomal-protein-alanine N-acetyltransferase